MKNSDDHYKIASLNDTAHAVTIIKEAENQLTQIAGHEVTLIAYEKNKEE
ncbi:MULTISPECIES: hypothetical protein [unclassified Paenibacillus]|nr:MULTISPECIES: hypothetical protein [unclassified Paenibacillus]